MDIFIVNLCMQECATTDIIEDLESSHMELCENSNAMQPLYDGAKVTVLEALTQFFEWFTDHPGTSKEALSNMFYMRHEIPCLKIIFYLTLCFSLSTDRTISVAKRNISCMP